MSALVRLAYVGSSVVSVAYAGMQKMQDRLRCGFGLRLALASPLALKHRSLQSAQPREVASCPTVRTNAVCIAYVTADNAPELHDC